MCHHEKPEADFAFRSIATGVRQDHCRVCHAAYRRQHYLNNREAYIKREVARMKGYREQNRVLLVEYLRSHPCVDCGEANPVVLDFDHVDPATKRLEVVKLAAHKPWHQVVAEIEKCEVRCACCHRRRTAKQFGWRRARPISTSGPIPVEVSFPTSAAALGVAVGSRTCVTCRITQPMEEFALKNAATDLRSTKCKACQRLYARGHYSDNRQSYLDKARLRRARERDRFDIYLRMYFLAHPCVDCGDRDPLVLEFDHRDPGTKTATVNVLVRAQNWVGMLSEIAKCDVRCANCHRRRTAQQFSWSRLTLQVQEAAA